MLLPRPSACSKKNKTSFLILNITAGHTEHSPSRDYISYEEIWMAHWNVFNLPLTELCLEQIPQVLHCMAVTLAVTRNFD